MDILPKRKSPRIPGYDYSTENYYFITICTKQHRCFFGTTKRLTEIGEIAERHLKMLSNHYAYVEIDKYVVMPNHVHMILILKNGNAANVNQIVAQYKSGVTREVRVLYPNLDLWQRSFHDHVIRDRVGYEKIWNYIEGNPGKWEEDCFYTAEG